jgi:hypothetical protein
MTLHHPEHGVIEIAPNARDLGRTAAHRGKKLTRNIGAHLDQVLHHQHVVPAIGATLPNRSVQIIKKKGSIAWRLEEVNLGHFGISVDWRDRPTPCDQQVIAERVRRVLVVGIIASLFFP